MNYQKFKELYIDVGPRFALKMARQEQVCTAGIQLWISRLRYEIIVSEKVCKPLSEVNL